MSNRDAFWIVLTCFAIVAGLLLAVLSGCGPPGPVIAPDVGPLILDEPAALNRPLGTMGRMQQLQARCWSIRLDWHHTNGWTIQADNREQDADWRVEDVPTLDAALRAVTP